MLVINMILSTESNAVLMADNDDKLKEDISNADRCPCFYVVAEATRLACLVDEVIGKYSGRYFFDAQDNR